MESRQNFSALSTISPGSNGVKGYHASSPTAGGINGKRTPVTKKIIIKNFKVRLFQSFRNFFPDLEGILKLVIKFPKMSLSIVDSYRYNILVLYTCSIFVVETYIAGKLPRKIRGSFEESRCGNSTSHTNRCYFRGTVSEC